MTQEVPHSKLNEQAESYTLDRLVFPSARPFPFEEAAKHYGKSPIDYTPAAITPIERALDRGVLLSPKQLWEVGARPVSRVESDVWKYLWSREKVDVYGNTGRPYHWLWKYITERALDKGHLRTRFKEIFYRPKHVDGVTSKGEAILRLLDTYKKVTHYDTDPWVIFGLSRAIPNAHFVWIKNGQSGDLYDQYLQSRFPNVRIEVRLEYNEPPHVIDAHPRRLPRKKFLSVFEEREKMRAKHL